MPMGRLARHGHLSCHPDPAVSLLCVLCLGQPGPGPLPSAHAQRSSLSAALGRAPSFPPSPASRGGSAVTWRGRRHGGAGRRLRGSSRRGDAAAGRGEDGAVREGGRRAGHPAPRRAGAAGAALGLRAVTGPAALLCEPEEAVRSAGREGRRRRTRAAGRVAPTDGPLRRARCEAPTPPSQRPGPGGAAPAALPVLSPACGCGRGPANHGHSRPLLGLQERAAPAGRGPARVPSLAGVDPFVSSVLGERCGLPQVRRCL